ncbi:MAG TPA: hypothetical protein VMM15_41125 [Bradyrhizobium sp.]|nr:hypothetical protein [Bradyrhizobium sp.]
MEHPRAIAARVYSDQFLSGLNAQFGFDAVEPDIAEELRDIAFRYIVFRREENQPACRKTTRRQFLALEKTTERYLGLVALHQKRDLASDIHLVASLEYAENKNMNIPHIAGSERFDGNAYLQELVRLLELIRRTAAWQARHLGDRGGRPKNLGLEELTRKAAEFWRTRLNRRFSVDYNEGTGLTPAFKFVRALVAPLDDIPDRQIVTAMRAQIAVRHGPRPRR